MDLLYKWKQPEVQKVESWLQQNTFHCYDYKDLEMLYNNKNGRTISLVMPTLNEEDSVGAIIETILRRICIQAISN